ncbi:PREDICTED: uncharacterized protein LOC104589924 [Nelumbo nucifera]|uniref:Uncharacterized protein LOC104589924 n=1 Tax=Nelumbo nucifera TaxID=4432 RepID=A0A1U7ZF93_NELNU|nr:PREDICTED: uncharacterized protein LOC104589924 [Nelumbo nucifera]
MDRSMIDAANGCVLVIKTPTQARELIANMAANAQQFGNRQESIPRRVDEEEQEKDILETFRKVEVNIPLLDAVKQVPRYAKFLKELCTTKKKLKGNVKIERAMLDLEASINVMPHSIYTTLNLGPLKETRVILQLADRSTTYPKGVLEDVLVQVNDLVFPVDFYVIDMEEDNSSNSTPILLGSPFLKTSKTKIDVHKGTLTMEFDDEIINFNIYDAMKYPSDDNPIYSIDVIDSLAQEVFELGGKEGFGISITKHPEEEELILNSKLQETVATLNDSLELQQSGNVPYIPLPISNERPLPSILQAPIPDLYPPMMVERGEHRKLQLQKLEDLVYDD